MPPGNPRRGQKIPHLFQSVHRTTLEVTSAGDRAEADIIVVKKGPGAELCIWDTETEETNPDLSKPKPRGKGIYIDHQSRNSSLPPAP